MTLDLVVGIAIQQCSISFTEEITESELFNILTEDIYKQDFSFPKLQKLAKVPAVKFQQRLEEKLIQLASETEEIKHCKLTVQDNILVAFDEITMKKIEIG